MSPRGSGGGHDHGRRTMSSLKELQEMIHAKYGIEAAALDPHASMREKGIDSLALVEFLFAVEDHYAISVPDEYSSIDTLAELAAVVDKVRAQPTA